MVSLALMWPRFIVSVSVSMDVMGTGVTKAWEEEVAVMGKGAGGLWWCSDKGDRSADVSIRLSPQPIKMCLNCRKSV